MEMDPRSVCYLQDVLPAPPVLIALALTPKFKPGVGGGFRRGAIRAQRLEPREGAVWGVRSRMGSWFKVQGLGYTRGTSRGELA